MTNFSERLTLYQDGGMLDENDVKDVNAIINLFKKYYGIELVEENADAFIAHICSAYFRNRTGETIEELPETVKEQLLHLDTYKESLKILDQLIEVTNNHLNQIEKGYVLLHINNLIKRLKENGEWLRYDIEK